MSPSPPTEHDAELSTDEQIPLGHRSESDKNSFYLYSCESDITCIGEIVLTLVHYIPILQVGPV